MKYLFLALLLSCTSYKDIKEQHLLKGSCENEFAKTELPAGQTVWLNTKEATQTSVSYLVSGLGYSSDFIVSFSSGMLTSLAICSPLMAAEFYSKNGSSASGFCAGTYGSKAYHATDMGLGPKAKALTSKWRCPDLDAVTNGLLSVASCYETSGNTILSLQQLQMISDSHVFAKCLSDDKKQEISSRIQRLSSKPL